MGGAFRPASVDEAQAWVRQTPRVAVRGGGTKWGLADPPAGASVVETGALSGIVEYDPEEFTFTALAGTPLAEVQALLAREGQCLPFDPPFAGEGATVGGALAAGLSGPSRLRFGGVRDFVLGIRFIDGEGRLVRGGGRVVKNAAGFDLPKLFCGSRGRLGLIVEATFKVFPRPEAYATFRARFGNLATAAAAVRAVLKSQLEPHAVDLAPCPGPARGWEILVRLGGPARALPAGVERVRQRVGRPGELLTGDDEAALWDGIRDLAWAPRDGAVVRLLLLPTQMEAVDGVLERAGALRRYSLGGNVAWAAFADPPDWDGLARELGALGVAAMALSGAPPGRVWLCGVRGAEFARRVKAALDPAGRFGGV